MALNSAQAAETSGAQSPVVTVSPAATEITGVQAAPNLVEDPSNINPTGPDPVKTCEAFLSTEPAPPKKKGVHPIRFLAKAVASELGTDMSDMAKDSVLVFSAKAFDPYDKSAPTNKPYTLLEIQLVDGSECSLIKYPDNSGKIKGGYADGTIIAPLTENSFIVAYPNGVRGRLVKVSGNEFDIYRPDKTITRITKTAAGDYTIKNSKLGYIGTARTDTLGMQYELNSPNF